MKRPDLSSRNFKHGMTFSRAWVSWTNIMQRCLNVRNSAFKNYGGRGITVCDRWREFVNFHEDMGDCPEGMSIDRIDNDGNYEPGNCRWATRNQQNRNSRHNVYITIKGETKCQKDWAREAGISGEILAYRLKQGWPEEKLLIPPTQKGNPNPRNPWRDRQC